MNAAPSVGLPTLPRVGCWRCVFASFPAPDIPTRFTGYDVWADTTRVIPRSFERLLGRLRIYRRIRVCQRTRVIVCWLY